MIGSSGYQKKNENANFFNELDTGECEKNITWFPDVVYPVSWGFQTFYKDYGSPTDLLVYYPSCHMRKQSMQDLEQDISAVVGANPVENRPARMLQISTHRWPIVILLHGNMPYWEGGTRIASHKAFHRMYARLASTLARSGNVVVVPRYDSAFSYGNPLIEHIELIMEVRNWLLTQWNGSPWLASLPKFMGLAGHSNGALLSVAVASQYPEFGALVSLGGLHSTGLNYEKLTNLVIPSFLMMAEGAIGELTLEFWQQFSMPKYAAIYHGTHFDYLEAADSGTLPRGVCPHIPSITADLVALFFSKMLNNSWTVQPDLQILGFPHTPTLDQGLYLNNHLSSFQKMDTYAGCGVHLHWDISGVSGSRHIGQT